jgi:hypothetical protein
MASQKNSDDPTDAQDSSSLPSIPRQYAPIVRTEDEAHVSHDSTRQARTQDTQPRTAYGLISEHLGLTCLSYN